MFYHVDAGKRLCVDFHGKLTEDQTALFDRRLDLPTELFAVIGDMGERVMPLAGLPQSPRLLLPRPILLGA